MVKDLQEARAIRRQAFFWSLYFIGLLVVAMGVLTEVMVTS
ncbi:hypothetical protein ACGRH2_21115 [Vibrio barjaei]|jgi:hypothetical protein|uniref:DUF3265 domain-containing protein n=1 Tax=Vibrio barjaei TaxID=1676683 RepID=A0ABW7IMQ5_9VIBR